MFLIECPHCGPRDEIEFTYGKEAYISYPGEEAANMSDEEWARFLFYRKNPEGDFAERWVHAGGCRKWFNAIRNTKTYEFKATWPTGQEAPDLTEGDAK